jgi:hypothetical protein
VAAAVAAVPAESAIAGKRLTLIEQAKGCHESMAPFFCAQTPFRDVPCVGRGLSRCEVRSAVREGGREERLARHAPRNSAKLSKNGSADMLHRKQA